MLDRAVLEDLLAEVRLAPSAHNTQPTRWRLLGDDALLLLEDVARRLPVADPTGHDVRLSHGAAIEGLSLALGRRGLQIARIERDDGPGEVPGYQPIARMTLAAGGMADRLAAAVAGRHSWRGRFLPADAALHEALGKLASSPDLAIIPPGPKVSEIAELGDRAGFHFLCQDAHRRELLAWMRLSPRDPRYHRDGLNAEAMALGRVEAAGASLVLGPLFPLLNRLGLAERLTSDRAKTETGAIALFHRPIGEDLLETGRAFYRAWLAMAARGLSACPISVLADWPVSNAILTERHPPPVGRKLVNVFRVGIPSTSSSVRRVRLPVSELVI